MHVMVIVTSCQESIVYHSLNPQSHYQRGIRTGQDQLQWYLALYDVFPVCDNDSDDDDNDDDDDDDDDSCIMMMLMLTTTTMMIMMVLLMVMVMMIIMLMVMIVKEIMIET